MRIRRPVGANGALWRGLPRLVLVAAALAVMLATPGFFTTGTLSTILALASIVGVLAVGQAFVLIGGGFDLSQGAAVALVAAVTAQLAGPLGVNPWLAGLAALALGAGLGAINGLFVAAVGTNPFVTTLSTTLIFRGAAFVLLRRRRLISGVTAFQALSAGPTILGTLLPIRGLIFLGVTALAWLALRWLVFGRHVYAVGGNLEAARLSGIRTVRVRVATFALSGLAAGLAAVLLLSWVRVAKPDTAVGYELNAIAACVVGGIALQGGSGSVLGAAAGSLLLQALATWITIRGFPDEFRNLVTGTVILLVAATDAWSRRRLK